MNERNVFHTGIDPIYSISQASKVLKIHPRTLLKYEKLNLLKPHRNPRNNRRLYTGNDIQWVVCLMRLVHQDGYSLKTLGSVLTLAPCWMIKGCPTEIRVNCDIFLHRDYPCWSKEKGKSSDVPCHQCVYYNHFYKTEEQQSAQTQKDSQEKEAGSGGVRQSKPLEERSILQGNIQGREGIKWPNNC